MRTVLMLLLAMWLWPATAEVFKCVGKQGVASYQSSPCRTATKQQQLNIKSDPAKEAAAKVKLEEVRDQYASRKAAQLEAEKQGAEQRYKAAKLELAREKVIAQKELAAAKRHQTEFLKQKRHRRSGSQHKPVHKGIKHAKR